MVTLDCALDEIGRGSSKLDVEYLHLKSSVYLGDLLVMKMRLNGELRGFFKKRIKIASENINATFM